MARQVRTGSEPPTETQTASSAPAGVTPPATPPAQRARELWLAGALAPHDESQPETTGASRRVGRASLAIVVVSILGAVGFTLLALSRADWALHPSGSPGGFGLAAAFAFLMVVAVALHLLGTSERGMFGFAFAGDGRLSASHLQFGVWMVLLGSAFSYFLIESLGSGGSVSSDLDRSLRHVGVSYLVIVGGCALAVVVRTAVAGAREVTHRSPDVADMAFMSLNLVAMAWFVASIASHRRELPTIPGTLVGLVAVVAVTHALLGVAEAWAGRAARRRSEA